MLTCSFLFFPDKFTDAVHMQGIHSDVVSSRSVHILITIGKYCQEDNKLEIIRKFIFFRILLMGNSKDDQGHKDKFLDFNTKILSQ